MKFAKTIVLSLLSSLGLYTYAQDSDVPKTENLDAAVEEAIVPSQAEQPAPKKAAKKKMKKSVKVKKINKVKKVNKVKKIEKVKKMSKKAIQTDSKATKSNGMEN